MRDPGHFFSRAAAYGCAVALAFSLWGCGKPATPAPGAKAEAAAAVVAEAADFGPLKGKWVRQDGDYMIEIKSIAADGKMDAGYFNPRPIHVGKAEAEAREGSLRAFVLLADQGYPGSNYKLKYDKESDTLQGSYHQAASGETFGVIFDRLKEE
ncbi:MAG: hypothetical protein IT577_08925 [Verrucomicrobiae bacterium]|nr:hypothetical protein [Verrucomicrobiae bacterium]